jgi:hypothetical protein
VLEEFIQWLPDLLEHEQYYVSLFARKKYCPEIKWIKSDKGQLKRVTATKDNLISKIRQMECAIGSYCQRGDNTPFPQESLALYISPNPRDLYVATLKGLSTFAKLIELHNKNHNPHQEIMSVIQQSCSRKIWTDFDIDTKEDGILDKVHMYLGEDSKCRKIMETRGGYHVLVNAKLVPEKVKTSFYKNMTSISDVKGDCMIPVPGCTQGMFMPTFIP